MNYRTLHALFLIAIASLALTPVHAADAPSWYHSHAIGKDGTVFWVDVFSPDHYIYHGSVVLNEIREIWVHVRNPSLISADNELKVRLRDGSSGAEPATEITLYRESKDPTQFTARLDADSEASAYFRKSALQIEIPELRGERLRASYVSEARLRKLVAPSPDAPGRGTWSRPVRLDHRTN